MTLSCIELLSHSFCPFQRRRNAHKTQWFLLPKSTLSVLYELLIFFWTGDLNQMMTAVVLSNSLSSLNSLMYSFVLISAFLSVLSHTLNHGRYLAEDPMLSSLLLSKLTHTLWPVQPLSSRPLFFVITFHTCCLLISNLFDNLCFSFFFCCQLFSSFLSFLLLRLLRRIIHSIDRISSCCPTSPSRVDLFLFKHISPFLSRSKPTTHLPHHRESIIFATDFLYISCSFVFHSNLNGNPIQTC